MRFLVDENVFSQVASLLEAYGHDVVHIGQSQWRGVSDPEVWQLAVSMGRVLVTGDLDFPLRDVNPVPGLILMRFPGQFGFRQAVAMMREFLDTGAPERALGCIVVLRPGNTRIRRFEDAHG